MSREYECKTWMVGVNGKNMDGGGGKGKWFVQCSRQKLAGKVESCEGYCVASTTRLSLASALAFSYAKMAGTN